VSHIEGVAGVVELPKSEIAEPAAATVVNDHENGPGIALPEGSFTPLTVAV
jgi:hypothetical protein